MEDVPSIYVPIQNSEEKVQIPVDKLPEDSNDVLDILKAEEAPLDLWLELARAYHQQGKYSQFVQILEEGSSEEIDEHFPDAIRERVAILIILASFYTEQARLEKEKKKRDELFNDAATKIDKASRLDQEEQMNFIARGQLHFAKGDLDNAAKHYDIALEANPGNVAAILCKACILFNKGDFKGALHHYTTALRLHPGCPANVRLGIGLCLFKLGRIDKARQAFTRVLELDPNNVEALVARAVIELNQAGDNPGRMLEGMSLLKQSFDQFPGHPVTLNCLADHFFYLGQLDKVKRLADTALAATDLAPLKAESFYQLARWAHCQGNLEQAELSYYNACKHNAGYVLSCYGLGQIHLFKGKVKEAMVQFEKVLKECPDNYETLKVLAAMYAQAGKTDKALAHFKRVVQIDPGDVASWMSLAEIQQNKDHAAASEAYEKALKLLRSRKEEVPCELLNNLGVLQQHRKNYAAAEEAFRGAMAEDGGTHLLDPDTPYSWQHITPAFNLARLYEKMRADDTATTIYRKILKQYPSYLGCHLRLASLAMAAGNLPDAIEEINLALAQRPSHVDALCMLGSAHMRAASWTPALEALQQAKRAHQEQSFNRDSYSTIAMGNAIYLKVCQKHDLEEKRGPLDPQALAPALDMYKKVLAASPHNVYAANGVGIVLAERGRLDAAKEVFTLVQEAAAGDSSVDIPSVWVNLAHVYLGQEQYINAIKMYQNCLKKFHQNHDVQLHQYIARAHYDAGDMLECRRALLKALHLSPANLLLRFDAALTLQEHAVRTLKRPLDKISLKEMRQAVKELELVRRIFAQLSSLGNQPAFMLKRKNVEMHVEFVKVSLSTGLAHLREKQRLVEVHERAKQARLERDAEEKKRRAAEAAQREKEERARLQAEEERAQEARQRIRERALAASHGGAVANNNGTPSKKRRKSGADREEPSSPENRDYAIGADENEQLADAPDTDEDEPAGEGTEAEDAPQDEGVVDEDVVDEEVVDAAKAAGLDSSDEEGPASPGEGAAGNSRTKRRKLATIGGDSSDED
eukprot:jgi/Mesvir1/17895/Mv12965-RA.1